MSLPASWSRSAALLGRAVDSVIRRGPQRLRFAHTVPRCDATRQGDPPAESGRTANSEVDLEREPPLREPLDLEVEAGRGELLLGGDELEVGREAGAVLGLELAEVLLGGGDLDEAGGERGAA